MKLITSWTFIHASNAFRWLLVKNLVVQFWPILEILSPRDRKNKWQSIETQMVFQCDSMDFTGWYNPSQAYTVKHVSYKQPTATRCIDGVLSCLPLFKSWKSDHNYLGSYSHLKFSNDTFPSPGLPLTNLCENYVIYRKLKYS